MPHIIISPPIVGVPAFLKWVCGPSARIGWPLPCRSRNELMIIGPNMKTMTAAVISAPPVLKVM